MFKVFVDDPEKPSGRTGETEDLAKSLHQGTGITQHVIRIPAE